MPFMDREGFIRLLQALGDPDDTTALSAARTIHARIQDAGIGWDALLVPAEDHTDAPAAPSPEDGDDGELIERILAEYDLSSDTRRELMDLRSDIAAGEFSDLDRRYVRDLAARLDAARER